VRSFRNIKGDFCAGNSRGNFGKHKISPNVLSRLKPLRIAVQPGV
jgi:hypothetical protein